MDVKQHVYFESEFDGEFRPVSVNEKETDCDLGGRAKSVFGLGSFVALLKALFSSYCGPRSGDLSGQVGGGGGGVQICGPVSRRAVRLSP